MGSSCSKKSKDTLSIGSEESAYGATTKNEEPPPEKPVSDLPTTNSQAEPTHLSAPPPTAKLSISDDSSTRAPKKDKLATHLPDLSGYNSSTRDLIVGKMASEERKSRINTVYVFVLGDSQDSSNEKEALEKEIMVLQSQMDKKGIEVISLSPDLDLLFPEFPFSQTFAIKRFMEDVRSHGLIIPIILLNETTGSLTPPRVLTESQYQTLASLPDDDRQKIAQWYTKDNYSRESQYVLNWPETRRDMLKKSTVSDYMECLKNISSECTQFAEILAKAFEFDKKKCPVKTPQEQLIPDVNEMNNRTTIWVERKSKKTEEMDEKLKRKHFCPNPMQIERLKDLKTELGDKVTAGNKINYELDLSNLDKSAIQNMVSTVSQRIQEVINTQGISTETNIYVKDGVKTPLLNEIENHSDHCKNLASTTPEREDILQKVKEYITGTSSEPLLIHGDADSCISLTMAHIAFNCHKWLPDSCLVQRFIGLTQASSIPESLIQYLFDHCLLLLGDQGLKWDTQDQISEFLPLLQKATADRPIILILDGLHNLDEDISWLPESLPPHVKLILSTAGSVETFSDKIQKVQLNDLDPNLAKKCVKSLLERDSRSLSDENWNCVSKSSLTTLSLCVISREIMMCGQKMSEIQKPAKNLFEILQNSFMKASFEKVLACLTLTSLGLSSSDIYAIFLNSYKKTSLAVLDFVRFMNLVRPFISRRSEDGISLFMWIYPSIRDYVEQQLINSDSKKIEYYKFMKENLLKMKFKDSSSDNEISVSSKRLHQDGFVIEYEITKNCSDLFHSKKLLTKIKLCGPYKVLCDTNTILKRDRNNENLKALKEFLVLSAPSLDYEPTQIYTQLHQRLKWKLNKNLKMISALLDESLSPPIPSLVSFSPCLMDSTVGDQRMDNNYHIDDIFRIKNNPHHIISTAKESGELLVWDIHSRKAVRTLKGLKQPRNVKMIDDHKCIVLCDRELKIYNLDNGQFLMKLREMMNQRSPYFGLCNSDHVVALSRSRMNVNLMNLTNGTCVTTFKVGENRFLSSLIVSANGKICVCGDETSASLVMWNLEERKLIYELKMQNHEYYPRLAAITDDGTYVSCVCREVEEPAPNFIVVYELQSGTLFKRWKPESDTISINISTTGITCVIVGLEDCRIMAFDLIIGNLRWTVEGHTSPVDTLKVDPNGTVLLSYDSTGKDRSIRVWNLNTGANLATFTPDRRITACELTTDGAAIVVAFEGQSQIHTFFLCHNKPVEPMTDGQPYGEPENHSKIFELGQAPDS